MKTQEYLTSAQFNRRHRANWDETKNHIMLAKVLRFFLPNKFHHSPNGGWRHIATARRLKAMGTSPGFPDIFILGNPKYIEGSKVPGCVIELKVMGRKATERQENWLKFFKEYGYDTSICYSAFEAIEFLISKGYLKEEDLTKIGNTDSELQEEIKEMKKEDWQADFEDSSEFVPKVVRKKRVKK